MQQDLPPEMSQAAHEGRQHHQQLTPSWGRNADAGSSVLPAWKQPKPSPSLFSKVPAVFLCPPRAGDKHGAAPGRSLPGAAPGFGFPVLHKVTGASGPAGTGTPGTGPLGMCLTCQLCSPHSLRGDSVIATIRLNKTLTTQRWPDQRVMIKKIHNIS